MGNAPSFQFYPSDWQNDIKLQICSMGSQGVLINLMCFMHQSEEYGVLLIFGSIPDHKTVAKLLRIGQKKYEKWLQELIQKGVLQLRDDGAVFCKRMVKDEDIREKRRAAGALGGNPNLVKQKDKQSGKQKPTPSSSSSSSSSSGEVSNDTSCRQDEPDAHAQSEEKPPSQSSCPHQEILSLYHTTLPTLTRMRTWGEPRKKLLRTRWREHPDLGWWEKYFGYVKNSPFLMGLSEGKDGKPPFQADLEWLIKPTNMAKVIDGKYHR